jgi:hypothetical protein
MDERKAAMSKHRAIRSIKVAGVGFTISALLVGYVLSLGLWIPVSERLPPSVVDYVDVLYAPMAAILVSEWGYESRIGSAYVDYLNWCDTKVRKQLDVYDTRSQPSMAPTATKNRNPNAATNREFSVEQLGGQLLGE